MNSSQVISLSCLHNPSNKKAAWRGHAAFYIPLFLHNLQYFHGTCLNADAAGNTLGSRLLINFYPVSYTHLDVYKRQDTGVTSTTTRVIDILTESIKKKVPAMVITPVNSWVKPINRPSEN